MHDATVLLAALGAAIVGGIFYAFSSFVMQALSRIPPGQGIAAMNAINVVVVNPSFMLAFAGTALLCVLLAAGALFRWEETRAGLRADVDGLESHAGRCGAGVGGAVHRRGRVEVRNARPAFP